MLNENGKKVLNAAFGLPYTLRAEISKPDGQYKSIFGNTLKYSTQSLFKILRRQGTNLNLSLHFIFQVPTGSD